MNEQEKNALLARIEALESGMNNLQDQVETINKFISAMAASQSIETTMNEIESVAKQLTGCDKAEFFSYDAEENKFFSNGDYRNWEDGPKAESVRAAFRTRGIFTDEKSAFIPIITASGNSLGVIAAEKETGFKKEDFKFFRNGSQIAGTIELAFDKEAEHRGRITDELTHLKNRQGLNEHVENTLCGNLNDGKCVNLIMCDIDHFKNVNDTYGHPAGDAIFKNIRNTL